MPPPVITSASTSLVVRFVSDYAIHGRGFNATYWFEEGKVYEISVFCGLSILLLTVNCKLFLALTVCVLRILFIVSSQVVN